MVSSDKENNKDKEKRKISEIKIFPIPFDLKDINENISISTAKPARPSKEQIINKAIEFHLKGNIQKAIKCYQYCINKGLNDHRVFSNYGIILKNLNQLKEAEILLRKSIEIKSNFANAHYNLGNILKDLGNLKEAELSYRNAIKIEPNFADAYYNLGNIFKDLGNLKEAEISLQKAIKIEPNFADAHYNLGNIFKDLGNLKEAEFSYKKAIEFKPDFVDAYSNLGSIYVEFLKYNDAELTTRKAIELKPNYAEAYSNLGGILSELGKLEEAEQSLFKAIELKPDLSTAYWNLYWLSDSIDEAEERIHKCLNIDQNKLNAKIHLSIIKLHQGDQSLFENIIQLFDKDHILIRSIKWVLTLPQTPQLFFNKWDLYKNMIRKSKTKTAFYEYGVCRGVSFRYLIKFFNKGYGFDTFEGLPEDWNNKYKKGSFSAEGKIPEVKDGTFIVGKFEDTLPGFFSEYRPVASLINFDADLYSSTLCALNYSIPVIDKNTILIFDDFLNFDNWEQNEYKALNEFCTNNNLSYKVIAISYSSRQVAVKLIGV